MLINADRIIFRVDPKPVQTDRFKHLISLHRLKPAVNIGAGKGVHIAHMQTFGAGIRKHH